MPDLLIFRKQSDGPRAQNIIRRFAERTGLDPDQHDGSVIFDLGPDDHQIEVVRTLTEIDPEWPEHLSLGDPAAEPGGD
jgi:hypothetical protein